MTNKEACLIIDEFERYHCGDISDEQEEAFTLASRLLSCIPDEIEGDYDTLDTNDLMILFEALMSKHIEANRIFTQGYAEDYLTRLNKIIHYMKYHFLSNNVLHEDEKMTNGEIIRKFLNGCNIADEELAKIRICPYNVSETCNIDMDCDDCRLNWLKKDCSDFQPCANDLLD